MDSEENLSLDPYMILDVSINAEINDIKEKYMALSARYSQDNRPDDTSQKQSSNTLKDIQQAYEILSDVRQRAKYDALIRSRKKQELKRKILAFVDEVLEKLDTLDLEEVQQKSSEASRPKSTSTSPETKRERVVSIEKDIRERNRAFEKLKGRGSSRSSSRPAPKPPKREVLNAVPVEQLNLQTMSLPPDDVLVDIVAVHGLGAIPNKTWTWTDKVSKATCDWLCQENMLPSSVPHARILRFGYDSMWMGKTPIRNSLSTIAHKLLLSLNIHRNEDFCRPLIFIGHCFGGLVIQRALNIAKMQEDAYPWVLCSSTGIIFLGTPHRGTKSFAQDGALFAAIAASSELSQNLETGILRSMESENGGLLDVTEDFVNLCSGETPMLSCFFEQRPSRLGKLVDREDINEFIVDQTSATLDGKRRYGLELDHFSLNKFRGPDDPNYVQVRAEIVRFYATALKKVKLSYDSAPNQTKETASFPRAMSTNNLQPPSGANQCKKEPALRHVSSMSNIAGVRSISSPVRQGSPRQSAVKVSETEIKLKAVKELHKEESEKQRLLYQEQLQLRSCKEKRLAEHEYLKRVKQNMLKYGIENPDEIFSAYPLPKDENLKQQEIRDKDKWYKTVLKIELERAGLDGGEINEILYDTGDMMMFDGVEMTTTKMARKWTSTHTLDHYKIPWQNDPDDESAIIIKRWVPDYEREFLWELSHVRQENRGRRPHRDKARAAYPKNGHNPGQSSIAQEKHWISGLIENFKEAKVNGVARRESTKSKPQKTQVTTKHEKRHKSHRHGVSYDSDPEHSRYKPRRSAPLIVTSTSSPQREASMDSTHSAPPDYLEVNRRRRHSHTLSRSRERVPIARHSGEHARWKGVDESQYTGSERTPETDMSIGTRERAKSKLPIIVQERHPG